MNKDFETVRNGLYGGAVYEERERALVALDRIEAQHCELKGQHDMSDNRLEQWDEYSQRWR